MSNEQIKPCPFCGSEKISTEHDDGLSWEKCKSCGATGPASTRYSDDESLSWDTRYAHARYAGSGAEAVYQRRFIGGMTGWSDIDKTSYHHYTDRSEFECRVLYTHPAPAVPDQITPDEASLLVELMSSALEGKVIHLLGRLSEQVLYSKLAMLTQATKEGGQPIPAVPSAGLE